MFKNNRRKASTRAKWAIVNIKKAAINDFPKRYIGKYFEGFFDNDGDEVIFHIIKEYCKDLELKESLDKLDKLNLIDLKKWINISNYYQRNSGASSEKTLIFQPTLF